MFQEKTRLENQYKVKLIHKCPYYVEWPTLSIYDLVTFTKWKKFPPGHGEFNVILDYFIYVTLFKFVISHFKIFYKYIKYKYIVYIQFNILNKLIY